MSVQVCSLPMPNLCMHVAQPETMGWLVVKLKCMSNMAEKLKVC